MFTPEKIKKIKNNKKDSKIKRFFEIFFFLFFFIFSGVNIFPGNRSLVGNYFLLSKSLPSRFCWGFLHFRRPTPTKQVAISNMYKYNVPANTYMWVCRRASVSGCRGVGVLVCRCVGVPCLMCQWLVGQHVGASVCQRVNAPVYRGDSVLVCQRISV